MGEVTLTGNERAQVENYVDAFFSSFTGKESDYSIDGWSDYHINGVLQLMKDGKMYERHLNTSGVEEGESLLPKLTAEELVAAENQVDAWTRDGLGSAGQTYHSSWELPQTILDADPADHGWIMLKLVAYMLKEKKA